MAPRTDRTRRIPSSVASPVTTNHACVWVKLKNGGNFPALLQICGSWALSGILLSGPPGHTTATALMPAWGILMAGRRVTVRGARQAGAPPSVPGPLQICGSSAGL